MATPYAKILADPAFQRLVATRRKLTVLLSVIMLAVYFAFILTIAFAPEVLGQPVGEGPMSIGIPIGIGIILIAFALTGIYVRLSNSVFDKLTHKARVHLLKGEDAS